MEVRVSEQEAILDFPIELYPRVPIMVCYCGFCVRESEVPD